MPMLNWVGRKETVRSTKDVVMKILREDKSLSYNGGDVSTQRCKDAEGSGNASTGNDNILVHGDNLEALKALLPFYAGQVKCIYIDPPYNTGSAFEHYDDNIEHSKWLNMMYPRLKILREFLREDGSIWISIDDRECHYLKVICDEIFGRENHLSTITIKVKAPAGVGQESFLFDVNEYILVYAKNQESVKVNVQKEKTALAENTFSQYSKIICDISCGVHVSDLQSGKIGNIPLLRHDNYKIETIKKEFRNDVYYRDHVEGIVRTTNPQGGLMKKLLPQIPQKGLYSITYMPTKGNKKDSGITYYFLDGALLVWLKDSAIIENGKIFKLTKMTNLWLDNFFQGIANEGAVTFLHSKKPEALINRIFDLSTQPGDFVLDSFLGSGTTAAVAHKMGRRWIGIEMGDHAKTLCAPRLKGVCEGEQSGISKAVGWKGGGGFRFFELGEPIVDENGAIAESVEFETLAAHIWWRETGTAWQCDKKSTVLGVHKGVAYALLYNGILHDRSVGGGNVLTSKTLRLIREDLGGVNADKIVVYAECTRLGEDKLKSEDVEFRQTPYDIIARR